MGVISVHDLSTIDLSLQSGGGVQKRSPWPPHPTHSHLEQFPGRDRMQVSKKRGLDPSTSSFLIHHLPYLSTDGIKDITNNPHHPRVGASAMSFSLLKILSSGASAPFHLIIMRPLC